MDAPPPPDISRLIDELDANERDARTLVEGLTEADGTWRAAPESWSVAECLDHLAIADTVYIQAMADPAARARARARLRRGPAVPGLLGGWFARSLEPPAKKSRFAVKAPKKIVPRTSPPLHDSFAAFLKGHALARAFLREHADLDLTHVHFPNPFVTGLRFSLATGMHVITAHERRHLWQAWNVRRAVSR